MVDDRSPRRGAGIPIGLAGMLAIVAAVEMFLGSRDVATTTHLVDSWTEARAMASSDEVRGSAVLCLGDSQIQQGILPEVLGPRLGGRAYSLAVQGGQPAAAYALLRRALVDGAKPRAIVIGFFPGLLAADTRINARQWPEIVGLAGALDLAATARDPHLATTTLLGLALRSYRARAETRGDIASALRGEVDPGRAKVAADREARRAHRGALPKPERPEFVDDVPPAGPGPGPKSARAWRPRREHERAVRRLLAMAEGRGIAVYWVTTTLSPGARAVRDASGAGDGYDAFLRRLQAEFPGLTVLDVARFGMEKSDFCDPCHLHGRAAAGLTAAVADAIARGDRGPSRWVWLTPTGPAADDPRLARAGPGDGAGR